MASENVNIRITGKLRQHMKQQIGSDGLYDNASEYIRDLVRRDVKDSKQSWEWLARELEPALRAKSEDFVSVSADDVISRNLAKAKRS